MEYTRRIATLQSNLQPEQVFLLSRPADVQYYTGLLNLNPEERESFLVLSNKRANLLYPTFSPITQLDSIEYHSGHWPSDLIEVLSTYIKNEYTKTIFIDKSSLFVNEYEALTDKKLILEELNTTLLWQQRIIKDEAELLLLQKAGEITAQVMSQVLKDLAVGMSEKDVAQVAEIEMRRLGAERASFPPVIAFGSHSALPHHQPTDTKLSEEMVVLIDIGAKFNGYCGDMTRTVWFGTTPSPQFLEIKNTVHQAYDAAVALITADVSAAAIDTAARNVIQKNGYGNAFIHTTGHGVGLEIHEQPSLYYKKDATLPEGAVVTIEPGIYLDGHFGYRYENMIQVTENSGVVLT